MVKEEGGKLSFSRISGAVIIVANLGIGLTMAIKETITTLPDIPSNWAMLVGALYGLNVIGKKIS
jgi:hypothetical protein